MAKRILENSQEFLAQLANLIEHASTKDYPTRFGSFLQEWLPIKDLAILEFRHDMQPVLIHAAGNRTEEEDFRTYLGGIYMFDPFYEIYTTSEQRGVLRIDQDRLEALDDNQAHSEYFKYLGAKNEVGSLHDIDADTCVHVSLMAEDERNEYQIRRTIRVMRDLEPVATALFKQHYQAKDAKAGNGDSLGSRQTFHQEIVTLLKSFGADVLTDRELTILRNLLLGHSAKSLARALDLSPGTVAIHRSNIYRKMKVSSQAELSALFLDVLLSANMISSD